MADMSTIHYHLYVNKKYYPIISMILDYIQTSESMVSGKISLFFLSINIHKMTHSTLFFSSDIVDRCENFMHRCPGIIYVIDVKKNIVYKTNTFLRQLPTTADSVQSISPERRPYIHLHTEMPQYIWYRLYFTKLSHVDNNNVSKSELFAYIDHKSVQYKKESNSQTMNITSNPHALYTVTGPIYPDVTSSLTREDINKIFRLRYAIDCLNSQSKKQTRKHTKTESEWVPVYRGCSMSMTDVENLKATVGNIVARIPFTCATLNENEAKAFALADRKNPNYELTLEKCYMPIQRKEEINAALVSKGQTLNDTLIMAPCMALFRIDKMERKEEFWHLEATPIDEDDEELRSLISPWRQLFEEQYTFHAKSHRVYFHYLGEGNTSFLNFRILVDVVLRLESNEFSKQDLMEFCRLKYHNDATMLHQIDQFEQTYKSEDAILWYTKDSFLYRTLNESLRQANDNDIVKLRYFIYDLHNQLAKSQLNYLRSLSREQSNIVVYRGQTVPVIELERLQQHQCSCISMNSFLSTTANYEVAVMYAGDHNRPIEEGHVSVIFEISIDTRPPLTIPFARIDSQSKFKDEEEVLFSMAAVFRIQNVEQIDENFWHVKLRLDKNTDNEQWLLLTNHLND